MNPTFGHYSIEHSVVDFVYVTDHRNGAIYVFDLFYRLPKIRKQVQQARNEGKQPPASIDFEYLKARAYRSALEFVMRQLKSVK